MTSASRAPSHDPFSLTLSFVLKQWRHRPALALAIAGGTALQALLEMTAPIFAGRLVDVLASSYHARDTVRSLALHEALLCLGATRQYLRGTLGADPRRRASRSGRTIRLGQNHLRQTGAAALRRECGPSLDRWLGNRYGNPGKLTAACGDRAAGALAVPSLARRKYCLCEAGCKPCGDRRSRTLGACRCVYQPLAGRIFNAGG